MEDREAAESKSIEIERMTLNLAGYERWSQLYGDPVPDNQPLSIGGSTLEEVVEDIDEIDRYFDRLQSGEQLVISGAEVEDEGWI